MSQKVERYGYVVPQSKEQNKLEEINPYQREKNRKTRRNKIVSAAIVGVIICILFFLIKYFIGRYSHSLAIESDAVSSLTESYSSIVAAVGIILAHKRPDKLHPNGYGRLEFLTVIVGGIFVIVSGWHYLEASYQRILKPEISSVTTAQLIIIFITIFGKLFLFFHDKKIGKEFHSAGLMTASRSALLSCFSTLLIIISAVVGHYYHFDIDGYVGLIISFLMLATGFLGIYNGMNPLIGAAVSPKVMLEVRDILLEQKEIVGVYDLKIVNNGASRLTGTVNAEVPSEISAEAIYDAFRKARTEVYNKLGIDLTIGLLTVNYCNDMIYPFYSKIYQKIMALPGIEDMHGFNYDKKTNTVDLHVVVSYKNLFDKELDDEIVKVIQSEIPGAHVLIDHNVAYSQINPHPPKCKVNL